MRDDGRGLPADSEAAGAGIAGMQERALHIGAHLTISSAPAGGTEVRLDVPEDLPFVPEGSEPAMRLVTRGAEVADAHEIEQNPRAASVRLRAIERVRPALPRARHHRGASR